LKAHALRLLLLEILLNQFRRHPVANFWSYRTYPR
jgi:hypothetical protein